MAVGAPITDRNEYFKRVLAPAARDGVIPDVFARYGLDPDESQPEQIDAGLAFADKLWRQNVDHVKYGGLIKRLRAEHERSAALLRDPAARQNAHRELARGRTARDDEAKAEFEQLIVALREPSGTMGVSRRAHLEEVGAGLGLSAPEIAARLERERFIDDVGGDRTVLAADKLRAIDARLRDLQALIAGDSAPRTLFDVIGAPFSAPAGPLRAAFETAERENDRRPHDDDERTARGRVLVEARRCLIDGDPDLYRHSVVARVKDELRPRVQRLRQVGARVDERSVGALIEQAQRLGLDEPWARMATRELARAEGVSIDDDHPRQAAAAPQPPPAPPQPQSGFVFPVPQPGAAVPMPQPTAAAPSPPVPPRPSAPVPPMPGGQAAPVPPMPGGQAAPIPPSQPRTGPPPPPQPGRGPAPPAAPPRVARSSVTASLTSSARYWWVPALIPVLGTTISWAWAAVGARSGRYAKSALGWFLVNIIISGAAGGDKSPLNAILIALWIFGIVRVRQARDRVTGEIELHR